MLRSHDASCRYRRNRPGKSTVCDRLRTLGFSVGSADIVAREVFERAEINIHLADIVGLPFPVTPAQVRGSIMVDAPLRRSVNALMHPAVMEEVSRRTYQFVEVPLLIEACLQRNFQYVCVVTCSAENQRARLRARYGDEVDFNGILASQLPSEVKIAFADISIRTDGSRQSVDNFVDSWAKELFARSS